MAPPAPEPRAAAPDGREDARPGPSDPPASPGPPARPWGERLAFLRGFLRHPAEVGSVIPSSRWLEQRLVRAARPGQARVVVELGPGTGGTTRALLRALAPGARLLAIELSADFATRLPARARIQQQPALINSEVAPVSVPARSDSCYASAVTSTVHELMLNAGPMPI